MVTSSPGGTGTLFQGSIFWKLRKPYKHQESRLTGNKGFLRKARGVYQPHLMKKTGEKMSTMVGKPLRCGQKPTNISPWKAKPRIKTQHPSSRSSTEAIELENPSSDWSDCSPLRMLGRGGHLPRQSLVLQQWKPQAGVHSCTECPTLPDRRHPLSEALALPTAV